MLSRRPAFTLLETVIALAIAIVVMGAVLTANRVVQNTSQVAELETQQEAILTDTFDLLTTTHNSLRQAGQPFSSAFNASVTAAPLRIAPYRSNVPVAVTDPEAIKWCAFGDSSSCPLIQSFARPISGAYIMATALTVTGAEVIAVHKTVPAVNVPQIYDFTYVPIAGITPTPIYADRTADQVNWDFYRRKITIVSSTTPYPGFTVTATVWPMVNGQNRQGQGISRTVVYTDY